MLKFAVALVVAYGLLLAVVYIMQGRMLYLPHVPGRDLTTSPAQIGLPYEDVWIRTDDGVRLHGWFIPGESSRVLLFFHGNAGNISHRLDSIRQFVGLGLSVFIIEYRGYGQSEGRATEAGIYRDAAAAWRYLTKVLGVAPGDIVILGRSLGGSVASHLATRVEPLALVVESAFTSVPDAAAEIYPWLPVRWISRFRHPTLDHVRDVRCPVLVVHSRDDEIIRYHHGEAIFAVAGEPRTMLTLRGTHNDAFIRDEATYLEGVSKFLQGLPERR